MKDMILASQYSWILLGLCALCLLLATTVGVSFMSSVRNSPANPNHDPRNGIRLRVVSFGLVSLIVVLLFLTAATFWSLDRIDRAFVDYRRATEREARDRELSVVVAVQDLEAGALLNRKNFAIRSIPKTYLRQDALTPEGFDKVAGRPIRHPIKNGTPVFLTDVGSDHQTPDRER